MKVIYALFLAGCFLTACQSTSQSQSGNAMIEEAKEYFGDDYTMKKNGRYALFHSMNNADPLNVDALEKYYVYDIETNKKIKEGTFSGGHVKWYDETKIEIYSAPGIPQGDKSINDYTKIYDVVSKEEWVKSSFKKEQR